MIKGFGWGVLTTVLILSGIAVAGACKAEIKTESYRYTVLTDDSSPYIGNRVVKVRLDMKVSEQALRSIAEEIRDEDPHYENLSIHYYLTGNTRVAVPWASIHYMPDLNVKVNGLTEEEERKYLAEPVPEGREVVGRWISDQSGGLSGLLTVYVEGGTTFLERKFKGEGTMTLEAVEVPSSTGRRFDLDLGEYVVIEASGEIRYYTKDDSLFEIGRRVP